jgi:hypothetical protein
MRRSWTIMGDPDVIEDATGQASITVSIITMEADIITITIIITTDTDLITRTTTKWAAGAPTNKMKRTMAATTHITTTEVIGGGVALATRAATITTARIAPPTATTIA